MAAKNYFSNISNHGAAGKHKLQRYCNQCHSEAAVFSWASGNKAEGIPWCCDCYNRVRVLPDPPLGMILESLKPIEVEGA